MSLEEIAIHHPILPDLSEVFATALQNLVSWEGFALVSLVFVGPFLIYVLDYYFSRRPSFRDLLGYIPHLAGEFYSSLLERLAQAFKAMIEAVTQVLAAVPVLPFLFNLLLTYQSSKQGETSRRRRNSNWFSTFVFFIPKSIREPWAGDIHETREQMFSLGYSRWTIESATVVQLVLLILHWTIKVILNIARPSKKPSSE